MKHLKLFENIQSQNKLIDLFNSQYTREIILEKIKNQFDKWNIYISDDYIEDIDIDELNDSLEILEKLFDNYDDVDQEYVEFEPSISQISSSFIWSFIHELESYVKIITEDIVREYVETQLNKIFQKDIGILNAVYKKHKGIIEEFVDIPKDFNRSSKTGLWDLKR